MKGADKIKYSIVDIGSNTIRMNVYEIDRENGLFKLLFSEKQTAGLINYIEDSVMTMEGVEKLLSILKEFKYCSDAVQSENFICFATASLRNPKNSGEIIRIVKNRAAIDIDLISGEEESFLNFYALEHFFGAADGLLVDMGGGSAEFVAIAGGKPIKAESIDVGSLSLYKKFVSQILPKKEECEAIEKFADKRLSDMPWLRNSGGNLYIVGGTARSAAKIDMRLKGLQKGLNGYKLSSEDLHNQAEMARNGKSVYMPALIKEAPDRIHTYTPGMIFFSRIVKFTGCESVIVSSYGVREGYIINKILKKEV